MKGLLGNLEVVILPQKTKSNDHGKTLVLQTMRVRNKTITSFITLIMRITGHKCDNDNNNVICPMRLSSDLAFWARAGGFSLADTLHRKPQTLNPKMA